MCTVLVAANVVPELPFVVLANRDERLGRRSAPPALSPDARVLAPRDLEAGGTWLGLSRAGLFVALTNRYRGPADASRVSRGVLVEEALLAGSARELHDRLAPLPPGRHNGYHLLYADADGGSVRATASDGATLARFELGRGLHVITERSFGAGDDRGRLARIHRAWSAAIADLRASAAPPLARLERFTTVLAEHDEATPFDATCVHAEAIGYGTRSSMVLGATASGASRMLWAEGPPCRTPFRDVPEVETLGIPLSAETR